MSGSDPRTPEGRVDEQSRRADLWERTADERERLADERERLADEREALGDERERLADRQDRTLDHRESDQRTLDSWMGEVPDDTEAAAAEAALRRAEAGVRRADAEVLRARQASARVAGRVARREAARRRRDAAEAETLGDADEAAWAVDRRDFVAAERDSLADEREHVADERDETADLRERIADTRERQALAREEVLDERSIDAHGTSSQSGGIEDDLAYRAEQRSAERQRRDRAKAGRRAAAQDRSDAAAGWAPQEYGPRLLASFAELAGTLFAAEDMADVLPRVLEFTVDVVDACDWAAITLYRKGRPHDTVATHRVAAELEQLQSTTGTGPAPDALESPGPVRVGRLSDSTRWPDLAVAATRLGVGSCVSHGLFVHQSTQWESLGTFTLYGAAPVGFSDEDCDLSAILAAYTGVVVGVANRREDIDRREAALHRGLSTRDIIGQAKGILMERQHLSAGDAFDVLRRASQRLNRRLADVAEHLAETGELP
jgi:hypothetical protein